jgi:peroxiredoxin family protein
MGPTLVFLVTTDDPERLQRLALWVVTAASVGERVDVLLCAPSLRAWQDRLREPSLTASLRFPGAAALIAEARELGPVRLVACETELQLAGMDADAPPAFLDAVVSLPTFWRDARPARLVHL